MESTFEIGGLRVKSLKGTWKQAIFSILFPVLLILSIRWLFFEPFVIPSGSMIPNLLVHDHIIASKFKYGIRFPFTSTWLAKWSQPNRGDIVVFHFPLNPEVYYVKRLIGLPGDRIKVTKGIVYVNDQPLQQKQIKNNEEDGFDYFTEENHRVRYQDQASSEFEEVTVPPLHYFMMGDNRDQSSDSRVWGFLPEYQIVGQVKWIWLSCDKTLVSAPFLCDPQTIRWNRLLIPVK